MNTLGTRSNDRAALDTGGAFCLHIGRQGRRATDQHR